MDKRFSQTLITIKNSKPQEIPPFAQNSIYLAKEQLQKIGAEMKKISELIKRPDSSSQQKVLNKGKLALYFDQVYRIKRFLLIYSNQRLSKIEEQFWNFGGDVKNEEKVNMSQKQKDFLIEYKTIAMKYNEDTDMDLTRDLDPPLDTQVEVRFLIDCDDIIDEYGQVQRLEKNSGIFVKKKLIQHYLKQGYAIINR